MRRLGSTVIQCKLHDSWQWPLGAEDKEKQIRGTDGGVSVFTKRESEFWEIYVSRKSGNDHFQYPRP